MLKLLKYIAITAILFSFVILNIGFVPSQQLQVVLVNSKAQNQKREPSKAEIEANNSIIEYRRKEQESQEKIDKDLLARSKAEIHQCITKEGATKYQTEPCEKDAKSSRKLEIEQTNYDEKNRIELHPESNGTYYVSGSINGHTVKFAVDTGASAITLSSWEASSYGVTGCRHAISTTANGVINICMGTATHITFGNFELYNIEVAIMPNATPPLLGMNALSQFRIEHANGTMKISTQ